MPRRAVQQLAVFATGCLPAFWLRETLTLPPAAAAISSYWSAIILPELLPPFSLFTMPHAWLPLLAQETRPRHWPWLCLLTPLFSFSFLVTGFS